jgi:hypothetical protein
MQGTLVNPINQGYQICSSMVPQAGLISTDLGLLPGQIGGNSKAFQFDKATQLYTAKTVNNLTKQWPAGQEPNLAVAEAIFLQSSNATNWTRTFTVQ